MEAGVWELSDSDYKLLFLERSEFRFECDVCQAKPAVPQDLNSGLTRFLLFLK